MTSPCHALFRGSLHRRADFAFGTHQHRPGHVPSPLGPDRTPSKVCFFGIPEDYLLACSVVPPLSLLPRIHPKASKTGPQNPPRVLNGLLGLLCAIIGGFFASRLHQSSTSSPKYNPTRFSGRMPNRKMPADSPSAGIFPRFWETEIRSPGYRLQAPLLRKHRNVRHPG